MAASIQRERERLDVAARGIVEGFYGPAWSHEDRVRALRFAGECGMNTYVYAPKDDPYHRRQWRRPYPEAEMELLASLVRAAHDCGVRFVYAIHPGLSMKYSDPEDFQLLVDKCQQVWDVGVRDFALLFDDIPPELSFESDALAFPEGLGQAHGALASRFHWEFLQRTPDHGTLWVVPTDYAGNQQSEYRKALGKTLPPGVPVLWTGPDIVVRDISYEDVESASHTFGRDLIIWDNFPVNDFDPARLFLGPLQNREGALEHPRCQGLLMNPMIQSLPSLIGIQTAAACMRKPAEYDAWDEWQRAVERVSAEINVDPDDLRLFAKCQASWPPNQGGTQWPFEIFNECLAPAGCETATIERARDLALHMQAAGSRLGAATEQFEGQIAPWALALASAGSSLETGLDALSGGSSLAEVRAAQNHVTSIFQDVLRSQTWEFLERVVSRRWPDRADSDVRSGTVLVFDKTYKPATPSPMPQQEWRRFIENCGMNAEFVEDTAQGLNDPELRVIVALNPSKEGVDQVRNSSFPVIVSPRVSVALGLSELAGTTDLQDSIEITQLGREAGLGPRGRRLVMRGPSKVNWAEGVPAQRVLATTADGHAERVTIAMLQADTALPSGERLPGHRVILFLGKDGALPWMLNEAGSELIKQVLAELAFQ